MLFRSQFMRVQPKPLTFGTVNKNQATFDITLFVLHRITGGTQHCRRVVIPREAQEVAHRRRPSRYPTGQAGCNCWRTPRRIFGLESGAYAAGIGSLWRLDSGGIQVTSPDAVIVVQPNSGDCCAELLSAASTGASAGCR